ncbi:hypothetical protein A2572_01265 [Candidatus Collierbacteria bacterium RIFOXYD1_FULL_40_9]|uniref:Uncharacterized protein n=1 Tax=Candidatus Collierbacteria bacterium RIFOXYD1_FULL_40_9 TaxID=1817731 RepID=A0A1F5FT91_9BACT|nr:MAG: hypothetical protein A2572_01265 [Candidatus Collierbacteria bacterium RIFOXYD1_FULL_40_9]
MNHLKLTLWFSLCLPFFIGMGGVYALSQNDYLATTASLTTSLFMSLIIGIFLRAINVNWHDTKRRYSRKARYEFAGGVLFGLIASGSVASLIGAAIAFFASETILRAICLLPTVLTLYLVWVYFDTKKKMPFSVR